MEIMNWLEKYYTLMLKLLKFANYQKKKNNKCFQVDVAVEADAVATAAVTVVVIAAETVIAMVAVMEIATVRNNQIKRIALIRGNK